MEKLSKIKPVYFYLLCGIFFILSRYSEDGSILNYLFLLAGIITFITAIGMYFRN